MKYSLSMGNMKNLKSKKYEIHTKKFTISLAEAIQLIENKYGKEPLFTDKAKEIKKREASKKEINT